MPKRTDRKSATAPAAQAIARQLERLLRFVEAGPVRAGSPGEDGMMTLSRSNAVSRFGANLVSAALSRGLLRVDGHGAARRLRLDAAGSAWLKRAAEAPAGKFAAQHRALFQARSPGDPRQTVTVNLAESPLAVMARLKGRDGSAFLEEREIVAGERLRTDFDRGSLMPGIGMRWEGLTATSGPGAGPADLGDAALGARARVSAAFEAAGPEFAGLLADVCCFLKGLEQVERERGWPQRSAKLMVKAGLSVLARHYESGRSRKTDA